MSKHGEKKSKTLLYVLIFVVIIVLGIVFSIFIKSGNLDKSIKNEIITAENYEDISNRISIELKEDKELYYLSYSTMYYIMQDGMASIFTNPDDDTAMYKRIYGKTVQQLIDEGKQLMKENDVTVDEFKESLENANQNIEDFNMEIDNIK